MFDNIYIYIYIYIGQQQRALRVEQKPAATPRADREAAGRHPPCSMYICIYIYIYTYAYTYIHIHIYIYI